MGLIVEDGRIAGARLILQAPADILGAVPRGASLCTLDDAAHQVLVQREAHPGAEERKHGVHERMERVGVREVAAQERLGRAREPATGTRLVKAQRDRAKRDVREQERPDAADEQGRTEQALGKRSHATWRLRPLPRRDLGGLALGGGCEIGHGTAQRSSAARRQREPRLAFSFATRFSASIGVIRSTSTERTVYVVQ